MSADKSVADQYQALSDIEHILLRPGMYIGSCELIEHETFIADIDSETPRIIKKKIQYSAGLERIYEEILLNAFDHTVRDQTCNEIHVNIDQASGAITVVNNGNGIPVVMKEELGCYIPEMLFGRLRSGSNFDESQERLTGGQNGLGGTLCVLFSKHFELETVDSERKKHYIQTWSDNMSNKTEPVIKGTRKKPFTRIMFTPDLKFFNIEELSNDIVMLMKKRLIDIGYASHASVKTYYNGKLISIKKPEDYMKLYDHPEGEKFIVDDTCERWSVGVILSHDGFQHASFVNGIHTSIGGSHVDHVANQVAKEIIDKLKTKKIEVKPSDIKNKMFVFVKSAIVNPVFDSQSKECLKMAKTKFGSEFIMSDAFRKKLHTSSILKSMTMVSDSKKLKDLEKTSGVKTSRLTDMETLEDATWAGTAKGLQTRLILTEGLSARTFAMSALNEIGRNQYGIFPLKGKLLNVRNVPITRVSANEEIRNIVKILGLKYELKYESDADMTTLRYGGVISLTDADADGYHISGLIINYFHHFWPKLIERGYLSFCITPIVKVYKGKKVLEFYTLNKYEEWMKTAQQPYKTKYFKGLGTSTAAEAREALKNINQKLIEFQRDDECDEHVSLAFNNKRSDDRKEWLMQRYDPNSSIDRNERVVNVSDFINYELSHFSTYDCARSIPNLMDGLKPSQRKIIYVAMKHCVKNEMKVGQLGPLVSQLTDYHHGEQSLMDAIINLAQHYVGTNNINLLLPIGGFGCLDPETEVMLWQGGLKKAKDVTTDDLLVGDNGQPRKVLQLTNGTDEMYEITMLTGQKSRKISFKVNSQHKLTLAYSGHKQIYWKTDKKCWRISYFDTTAMKPFSKTINTSGSGSNKTYNKSSLTKEEAFAKMQAFSNSIDDLDVIDIRVCDFLKFSKSEQRQFKAVINKNPIEWESQPVQMDPYILGLWIGDGNANGAGIAGKDFEVITAYATWLDTIGCELVHDKNPEGHECSHFSVRNKFGKLKKYRTAIGDHDHSKESCVGCQTSNYDLEICNWKLDKLTLQDGDKERYIGTSSNGQLRKELNAHAQYLKSLGLYENKHIPSCYIYNSKEVRLQLLAGIIDTDGSVKYQGDKPKVLQCIEISQSARLRGQIINDLYIIAKSLGFKANIGLNGRNVRTKKGEDATMMSLTITGNDLHTIPMRVKRKQISPYSRQKNVYAYGFTIQSTGIGPFNGWEVDGNHRFLLKDYVITHNSRLQNGSDAASPRYIFTKLNPVATKIFDTRDSGLLKQLDSDGTKIEPQWYAPVLPMILVNGALGIGTGFSTSVLQYNPRDIAKYIAYKLNGKKPKRSLMPWYRGFNGTIEKVGDGKYITYGVWKIDDAKRTLHITELPINVWTDNYKAFCEKMLAQKDGLLSDIVYGNTDIIVDIKFVFSKTGYETFKGLTREELVKNYGLSSKLSETNMYLFNADGRIEKFADVYAIIDSYFEVRLDLYAKRREALIRQLQYEMLILKNKAKFITFVKDGRIDQRTMTEASLLTALQKDFDADPRSTATDLGKFDYLTSMTYRSFTNENKKKMEDAVKEKEKELKKLEAMTSEVMWLTDIAEVVKALG